MNAALEIKVRRKPRRVRPTTAEHESRLSQLDQAATNAIKARDFWREWCWIAAFGNIFTAAIVYLLARH